MFGITVNSRESYGEASLQLAATVEDARRIYVEAWGTLYDTEAATLHTIGEDLSTKPVYTGYADAQDTSGGFDPEENEDGSPKPWPIQGPSLADFYLQLAKHAD